jgi:hypothetical protein
VDWQKYASIYAEYARLAEHARQLSAATVGGIPLDDRQRYGEKIFVKLLAHSLTLGRLAPGPDRKNPKELWDLGSASAVARCLVEAYDAMAYISLGNVAPEEQEFRVLLWELHDTSRRIKMLEAVGSTDPQCDQLRGSYSESKRKLCQHPHFSKLSGSLLKKVNDDDPPSFHLSQRERCIEQGINFDYYNVVTMQLSQYVHTLPLSVHQLFAFKAGTPESLHAMALPMQYSLAFLSRAVEGMSSLFPGKGPAPNEEVKTTMSVWSAIAARGVKGAA